jgi:hypothetical protein
VFFADEQPSGRKGNVQNINSLNRPRFVSFVTTARIVSTSTIISTTIFDIVVVGVMLMYILSRRKKRSTRLKMSISWSLLALASLAAWESSVSKSVARQKDAGNRPKLERRFQQRPYLLAGMPKNKH